MEIYYGSQVKDKNGEILGSVNRIIKNSWSGDISKFVVKRNDSADDLFLSPEDVLEVTSAEIKLKINVNSEDLL